MSAWKAWTASATRSVPVRWFVEVITARPPNPRTAARIRSSSVATTTSAIPRALAARSYTCWMSGLPAISASGFPGKRVEAWRAGITTMAFLLMGHPSVKREE